MESPMLSLMARSLEFGFYHILLSVVDHVSRLPRNTTMPEAARLYRENIALKAQLDVLEILLARETPRRKRRASLRLRAAQVFAYFLNRENLTFQRFYLSAPVSTIQRWATRFRRKRFEAPHAGGRPELAQEVVELILTLKRENRAWGQRRIREELRRFGVRVSEASVRKVLLEHGYPPGKGRPISMERFRSAAKDAVWALDFFAVRVAERWVQVLLIIDIFTRERIDLRVHDGWDVESRWTARAFAAALSRSGRKPAKVIHDHGTHFMGQFERQLRVLEIERDRTVAGLPNTNCYAECAVGTTRRELLRHVRVGDAAELQRLLDEYRRYVNEERAHQGIGGQAPDEVSRGQAPPPLVELAELRQRRLVRREYAGGILAGYSLAPVEASAPEPPTSLAA